MKNKKGFTLVELLAVIAILAILVIIALPNVMGMFNEAKKSSFTTELKEIYKVAQQQWISDSMFNTGEKIYARCSSQQCANQLELTGRKELEYFIKISKSGNITEYYAQDGTYQFSYKGPGLLVTNITNVKSLAESSEEDKIQISCNKVTAYERIPDMDNRLAMQTGSSDEASNYLKTNIARKDIETITFVDSISGHTANGVDCFDLSVGNNGSVLGWVSDTNSNGLKELTIGSNGKTYAVTGNHLFSSMSNLTSINGFENFSTATITNMSYMFNYSRKLTSIDLSNFDTSKVTNMKGMFSSNGTDKPMMLEHIYGLENFDTSNVTDMSSMFEYCSNLKELNLLNFNTSNVTSMRNMFSGWFQGNRQIKVVDLSSFDTSKVTDMSGMFMFSDKIERIILGNKFNTSNVTNMSSMFLECKSLEDIDLSKFDTSKVTNMQQMFAWVYKLEIVDLSSFDTSKVTNMKDMFVANHAKTIYVSDKFVVNNITDNEKIFNLNDYLVGGAGTAYSASNPNDKTYAHIDGGTSNPGYFTSK